MTENLKVILQLRIAKLQAQDSFILGNKESEYGGYNDHDEIRLNTVIPSAAEGSDPV